MLIYINYMKERVAMKKIQVLTQKLCAIALCVSSYLSASAMSHEDKIVQQVLADSLISHKDKENHQLAEITKEQVLLEKQRQETIERARAADQKSFQAALEASNASHNVEEKARAGNNINVLDLINAELVELDKILKVHTSESLVFMDQEKKAAFYADLNRSLKSILSNVHGFFGKGQSLDGKTNGLLDSIKKALETIKNGLDVKEYEALVEFLHDIHTRNIVIPERSFESRTSQFALGDAGSSCGAMSLVALDELKKAHNSLQELQKKYPMGLDSILQKGKEAYTEIIKKLKKDSNHKLEIHDLQDSQAFKDAGITWQDQSALNGKSNKDIGDTIREHVLKPLEDATRAGNNGAAAGRAAGHNATAYGIFFFGQEIILLVYNAQDNKWILFDSHRRDKYEGQGAGYHQFGTKEELIKYLIHYPGLRAGVDISLTVYV